jgi:hypothetical protein
LDRTGPRTEGEERRRGGRESAGDDGDDDGDDAFKQSWKKTRGALCYAACSLALVIEW